ncbi:MAG: beta-propeller domain-containing protein [archaeon]|jgi:uncharacterized secreted protein with C-terminal beta-propeller domain|nr:beta-propeller domain-containing protein [archaeon]
MVRSKLVALAFCLSMLLSGCISNELIKNPDETPVELPDEWNSTPSYSPTSPALVSYPTCEALENSLKQSLREEARTQLLQAVEEQYYYYWGDDVMLEDAETAADGDTAGAADNAKSSAPRTEGEDFSGTNNQEEGVDEADFVKTDGYHIYLLQGQTLHILGVPEFGEIENASTMEIEGTPQAMMLDGDRLVVLSSVNPWSIPNTSPLYEAMAWDEGYYGWRTSTLTKMTVIDMTDREAPETSQELYIEGWYLTAREVAGTVRMVSHAWMDVPGLQTWLNLPSGYWEIDYDNPIRRAIREEVAYRTMQANEAVLANLTLEDLTSKVYEMRGTTLIEHSMLEAEDCANFAAPADGLNRGISSIFSIDLASEQVGFEVDHIIGNYPQVYASSDVLVLTENSFDWWRFWMNQNLTEMTNIHTFDISAPGETVYTGSGRVDGTILNQFSISEYEGILRVATTTGQWGRWWLDNPEPMSSQVVTLTRSIDLETNQQVLVEVGKVGGIAEGERIWSARFVGDTAYIVTFEQIDPLWVIDLSDVTQPKILGELEVPGVSTYIHPLEEGHLLTIGLGPANEDGTGLDWSSTQISLFDVNDPTAPTRDDVLRVSPVQDPNERGWAWSWSEATYEHKAFQYWGPKDLLSIPLSTYRYHSGYDENGNYFWNYEWVSKLVLIEVNETSGELSLYGEINNSDLYDRGDNRYWWNDFSIRRSIFMGDYIYAISSGGVTVTNLTTLEESDRVVFEVENPYYCCYYYEEDDKEVSSDSETATSDSSDPGESSSGSSDGSTGEE